MRGSVTRLNVSQSTWTKFWSEEAIRLFWLWQQIKDQIYARKMCCKVKCPKCGKYTWQGCGAHVAQVMAGIPPEQRCTCPRK